MDDLTVIKSHLSRAELWGQLAEEAAELAQAALKMQRLCLGRNLPRKSAEDCIAAVVEEHADVALCFEALEWQDREARRNVRNYKLHRWAEILRKEVLE